MIPQKHRVDFSVAIAPTMSDAAAETNRFRREFERLATDRDNYRIELASLEKAVAELGEESGGGGNRMFCDSSCVGFQPSLTPAVAILAALY